MYEEGYYAPRTYGGRVVRKYCPEGYVLNYAGGCTDCRGIYGEDCTECSLQRQGCTRCAVGYLNKEEGACQKSEEVKEDSAYNRYEENKGLDDLLFEPCNVAILIMGLTAYIVVCIGLPLILVLAFSYMESLRLADFLFGSESLDGGDERSNEIIEYLNCGENAPVRLN